MELQPESQIYSQPIGNTTITSPVPPTGNGSSVSSGSAKRRRTSTTGSRGVANLTPEQLAKKRANDREAQRAIRERTKTQIESLERKIQELTSQQPYQELQQVIRQKELVEAENDDIKKRLASVYTIVQPFGAVHGLPGIHAPGRLVVVISEEMIQQILFSLSTAILTEHNPLSVPEETVPYNRIH